MQINQIQFYGQTTDEIFNDESEDESVSIIGKVKRDDDE